MTVGNAKSKKKARVIPLKSREKKVKKKPTKAKKGDTKPHKNALKYGLYSRDIVLPWENPKHLRELRKGLADEFKPRGPFEAHLVGDMAIAIWEKLRLRRARQAVTELGATHIEGESDRLEKWAKLARRMDPDQGDDGDGSDFDEERQKSAQKRAQVLAVIEPIEGLAGC